MKIGSFEFNLRELAGSMGDFGTLAPLAIGYITVCGMNPAGLLVGMGLANVGTGLVYRLPMPIEPMKALAVVAIAQRWEPEKIYAAGFAMGAFWLLMAATGAVSRIADWTPRSVVRGIQFAIGALLAFEGGKMVSEWWALGALSVLVILALRENRYAPAALVLVALGAGIMAWRGELAGVGGPAFALPRWTTFDPHLLWPALRDGGFAQIPLTATNAVIATTALIGAYWPGRCVSERKLALNTGVINLVLPFIGGMPTCQGAGGLAGQHFFGARTGGANLIEGGIEIVLGLLFAGSVAALFAAFPLAIVGAMMLLVGVELAKFARDVRVGRELLPFAATVACSLVFNMAAGFAAGLAVHVAITRKAVRRA